MKLLKKCVMIGMLIILCVLSVQASAQEELRNSLTVKFTVGDIPTITEQDVTFTLHDETGIICFDTVSHGLKRGQTEFEINFRLPCYPSGMKFLLVAEDGVKGMAYNVTYSMSHIIDSQEEEIRIGLDCYWEKEATIKIKGKPQSEYKYVIKDDDIYVTTDLLNALAIEYEPHFNADKPFFKLYTDKYHQMTFYLDDIYAIVGNEPQNLASPVFAIDSMPYVPLSKVAVYFACNYKLENNLYLAEVSLTKSVYSDDYAKETFVNEKNVESKTEYMLWVSKKDFAVNVFKGNKNNWSLLYTFPCSIGAPKTPTIEGQFEYFQWQPKWTYPDHYCGPIMRFYRGYAFHSYLIRYNGKPYDGRLGMKISHGCVRMHPDDIGWMSENIPLYTKVYITP